MKYITTLYSISATAFLLVRCTSAFHVSRDLQRCTPSKDVKLMMSQESDNKHRGGITSTTSRRSLFEQSISTVLASVVVNFVGLALPIQPASAAVGGLAKVNAKLQGFGLPTFAKVPDGFSPLLEIYGKGKNRFPLLVTFAHPITWVVTTPSNNVNGEDGTVQAGDYAKGDTATFFVYESPGHVDDITSQPKVLFDEVLQKAIGQRGSNMFQNFKVTKLEPTTSPDGQKYMIADFKYQLLTGAGFEVDRKGVASVTSEGKAVEVLWSASTAIRFKKTEPILRDIVASFRVYADGINFSEELLTYEQVV